MTKKDLIATLDKFPDDTLILKTDRDGFVCELNPYGIITYDGSIDPLAPDIWKMEQIQGVLLT